jgi:hypothetical protein
MAGSLNLKNRTQAQNDRQQDAKKMLNRVLRVAELLAQAGNSDQTETATSAGKDRILPAKNTKH